ncbi:hypothetical protein A2U01_0070697, partial [Trifolium medium]|nr:hypothetical protein [Trifolium medium]
CVVARATLKKSEEFSFCSLRLAENGL